MMVCDRTNEKPASSAGPDRACQGLMNPGAELAPSGPAPRRGIIDDVMPVFRLEQIDRIAVGAPPESAWRAVRGLDLYSVAFVRALFSLRLLPEMLVALVRQRPLPETNHARIDQVVAPGSGWHLLGETAGREIVVGSVGKFWQLRIDYAPLEAKDFRAYQTPGFGKVAWSLRVDPREGGGSWITVDLRVDATDYGSWRKFHPYWRLIGRFSHAIRRGILHLFERRLGRAPAERLMPLPGDELLRQPRFEKTHARTIEAPAASLWPWLVQMGGQRAGWYSLDRLDNGGVPSAEQIVPALQHLAIGDLIPACPEGTEGFRVLRLERERLLVIGSPSLLTDTSARAGVPPPWRTTWAFHLQPIGGNATRLVVRVRADYRPSPRMAVTRTALAVMHELMERVQLHNLKRRAEARS
jgi:hypothetical protein